MLKVMVVQFIFKATQALPQPAPAGINILLFAQKINKF